SSDVPWTIPIVLDIDADFRKNVSVGDEILLTTSNNNERRVNGRKQGTASRIMIAKFNVEDIFKYDKDKYAESVFQTKDPNHPGVRNVMQKKEYLIGGKIDLLQEIKTEFHRYNLKPKETRYLFYKRGWENVVAFQTRNPPHLGHEYIQKAALSIVDGLLINPIIGKKKKGDFLDKIIIAAYETLMKHYYPQDSVILTTFETEMHYAGPKEAIHHAIARKNMGCNYFIVGRDHAGVGNYYSPFDAHAIFKKFPDLGIKPICFKSFYKCTKCGSVVSSKICPHANNEKFKISFKGTNIRKMLKEGKIPRDEMRPEVAETIMQFDEMFVK
ncbi:MAG: sulfate adenylyltransferase, partial [Promethearchaeota archaeon]